MDNIKSPEDILLFLDNIEYGYIDIFNNMHVNSLDGFRKNYRSMSIEEVLEYKLGTCIEQVYLTHYLLDKINIKNKMFCTRVYENGDISDTEDEHLHCFILYYDIMGVHQLEHANSENRGIHDFVSEEEALSKINKLYEDMVNGVSRPITEFFEVIPNQSFKDFNNYINRLDIEYIKKIGSKNNFLR